VYLFCNTMGYINIRVTEQTKELIEQCESMYRKHHPEFDGVPLSRNKILLEMGRYYLQ